MRTTVPVFPILLLVFFTLSTTPSIGCSPSEGAEDESPSIEEMIGQMLMVGFRGFEVGENDTIAKDIRERNLGGIILFDYDVPSSTPERNISSPAQVKELVEQISEFAETPLFIAIDQEGGRVNRLKTRFGFPEMVSHQYLGKVNDADTTRYYGRRIGETLASLGININFSPVVDVNSNPENPVIGQLERSFSGDPDMVTKHSRIKLEAFREYGVHGTVKHFPGHGSAWNDSHYGMADVTETWEESELEPYRALFADNSAQLVMSAHIFNSGWDPDHPATLVPSIMTGLLREELGFTGLLFSDDMQMGAITDYYGLEQALELAVLAGIDVLIFANNSVYEPDITERAISILSRKVKEGIIPEESIRESYNRIMAFKNEHFQKSASDS